MTTQIAAPVGPEGEGPIIPPSNGESDNKPLVSGMLKTAVAGVVLLTACDQVVVATEPQPGVFDGITTAEMLQATESLRELTVRWTGTDGTREEIQINAVGFVADAKTGELIQLRPLSGEPRSYAFAQALQLDEKGQIIKELPLLVEEKDNVRTVFLLVSSNPAPLEQGEKKAVSLLRVNNGTLETTTKQLFVFVNEEGKTTLAISDGDSQQELIDATASQPTPTGAPEAVIELLSFSIQEPIVDNPIVRPTAPATPSPTGSGVAQETVGAAEAEVPDVPLPTEPPATPTTTAFATVAPTPTEARPISIPTPTIPTAEPQTTPQAEYGPGNLPPDLPRDPNTRTPEGRIGVRYWVSPDGGTVKKIDYSLYPGVVASTNFDPNLVVAFGVIAPGTGGITIRFGPGCTTDVRPERVKTEGGILCGTYTLSDVGDFKMFPFRQDGQEPLMDDADASHASPGDLVLVHFTWDQLARLAQGLQAAAEDVILLQ